jgi:L-ascorbate metabolism protein UlaG (beta-lactamase superfamily)
MLRWLGRLHTAPLLAVLAAATACKPGTAIEAMPAPQIATGPGTIDITYVANEGVLLTAGDTRVLIDGLFRPYQSYAVLPPPDRERAETGQPPFDGVDLILVSHVHGDHFHPEAVARHLQLNTGATLVSSEQITAEVLKVVGNDDGVRARVRTITPAHGDRAAVTIGNIEVQVLGLRHGSARFNWIQNLGHVVSMGGKKVLHVGDADTDAAAFERLSPALQDIDVALLPAWYLTGSDGQAIVRNTIKPRNLIAVHLPTSGFDSARSAISRAFPLAHAFTALMDVRRY